MIHISILLALLLPAAALADGDDFTPVVVSPLVPLTEAVLGTDGCGAPPIL